MGSRTVDLGIRRSLDPCRDVRASMSRAAVHCDAPLTGTLASRWWWSPHRMRVPRTCGHFRSGVATPRPPGSWFSSTSSSMSRLAWPGSWRGWVQSWCPRLLVGDARRPCRGSLDLRGPTSSGAPGPFLRSWSGDRVYPRFGSDSLTWMVRPEVHFCINRGSLARRLLGVRRSVAARARGLGFLGLRNVGLAVSVISVPAASTNGQPTSRTAAAIATSVPRPRSSDTRATMSWHSGGRRVPCPQAARSRDVELPGPELAPSPGRDAWMASSAARPRTGWGSRLPVRSRGRRPTTLPGLCLHCMRISSAPGKGSV